MTLREIDKELLDACSELDENRVQKALLAGADPNCINAHDIYPLLACLYADGYDSKFCPGRNNNALEDEDPNIPDSVFDEYDRETDSRRIRIFDILIDHGADLNHDFRIDNAILWHTVHSSYRIMEYLLQKGANPNLKSQYPDSETPLKHAWLDESANHGCKKIVEKLSRIGRLLLSYGALPEAWGTIDEKTIDLSKIRTFENVPPFVHPEIPDTITPLSEEDKKLFIACKNIDIEAAILALDKGANINARNIEDDFATPLTVACRLIAIFEPEESDWTSEKAKERTDAIYRMISMLLERGANPNLSKLYHGTIKGNKIIEAETPLMFTAWLAKNVVFSTLLLENGANPNFSSESIGGTEETVMDLNCFDYNIDNPLEVKPIEILLMRFGGCESYIFKPDYCRGMRDVDAALVFACQRMDYHSVQVAAKLGGNLAVLDDYGRSLPVIVLEDAPQLCGKRFAENGWNIDESITDYLLFLLVGMKVQTTQKTRSRIVEICIDNGCEKTLQVLRTHHILGSQFRTDSVSQK